ncbi:MAG: proline iminopeptidase [Parcubacteria group bacterium]|nr:proline iminopeptidase [Parcubacteria group bacterium]
MKRIEGFIPVEGGKVWYEMNGEMGSTPLIVLHGGPGYPHDYLEPLRALDEDRQVLFYDQLGCGNSDESDASLWTVEHFVTELQDIVDFFSFEKYHLLGQSWGSALALSFALKKPHGLRSLILSDPYIGTPIWVEDAQRLIASLPEDMSAALETAKKGSEEYKRASREYYDRFVKRLLPYPEACVRSDTKMNGALYNYMWGDQEYKPNGTLSDFDLVPRLPEIAIPVLLLCGRYDEATPESAAKFQELLPNAQCEVFEDSAHFPFWNKTEEYNRAVQAFLRSQD